MLDEIEIKGLLEHCLEQVRKPWNLKSRFEHYVLMRCLENLSKEEFDRYKETFKLIIKE